MLEQSMSNKVSPVCLKGSLAISCLNFSLAVNSLGGSSALVSEVLIPPTQFF